MRKFTQPHSSILKMKLGAGGQLTFSTFHIAWKQGEKPPWFRLKITKSVFVCLGFFMWGYILVGHILKEGFSLKTLSGLQGCCNK